MYPYNNCKLIIPDVASKDQRWVIKFYVWDAVKGQKVLKRDLSCNTHQDIATRKKYCKLRMKEIDAMLVAGYHINNEKTKVEVSRELLEVKKQIISIEQLIVYVLEAKKIHRLRTYNTYKSHANGFLNWLRENKVSTGRASDFTGAQVKAFLDYLITAQGCSHRTRNNYLGDLKALFNDAVFQRLIDKNPCDGIRKLKTESGKNRAYIEEQMQELTDFMKLNKPQVLFFCQMMYYTLMRTDEIAHLRISDINKFSNGQIYLPKEFSKNRHERYVGISKQLHKIIAKQNLGQYSPDWYIFSRGFKPGAELMGSRYFGKWYRKWVLDKLTFPAGYTLYSWKHTGVCKLFKAGLNPADIYQLGGWLNWSSFQAYLRSLGLYDNSHLLTHYPEM